MQGKSHLYFLVNEINRSFYADGDVVKLSAVPRPLVFTPDGWTNIEINNQRNLKYFALDRNFTIPLDFVEDGALILKDQYYKKGVEAKVYLVILKQKLKLETDGSGNITGFGYYYDSFYKGEIDFSNFQHAGPKVTVNIMESGIPKFIKASENTKFEIDVDVPEARLVYMDGVRLKQRASFIISNGGLPNNVGGHIVETVLIGAEDITTIGAKSTERTVVNGSGEIFGTGENFLATGSTSTQVTINYDFGISLSLPPGIGPIFGTRYFFQLRAFDKNGVQVFFQNIIDFNPGDPLLLYRHHRFTGSATYNVPANATLFLDSIMSTNINVTLYAYDAENTLSVDYYYTHPASYIKVLPPLYVFKKLVEKVTGGAFLADSTILSSNANVSMTCGDAIRGISGAKIKTSLSDFFISYDVQFDIGLGDLGGVVRIEPKYSWIDYANPIDLGEVKAFKLKPATDYIVNTIKFGYPEQSYEDVNGRQEYNNTSLFTTPYTRVAKELNKVSIYRADCYGIEFTRINLEGKTTTDNSADNDVFLIHTQAASTAGGPSGTYYKLDRSLNPFASGVIDPSTVFNIYLTPKRCLERNGRYVHSLFYKLDSGKLVFQTTEKNAEFKTTSPTVIEKADVPISSLLPQLFTPNMMEFETPAPVDLIETLDASPVRAFSGSYLGVPFLGIPVKVGIASETLEEQDYSLLAAPSMNLEPLIQIFE